MAPLDYLIEQLWAPALNSAEVRVVVNRRENATWREAERYWLVPSVARARLLVPATRPTVTGRALTNYRNLRKANVNVARFVLGVAARCRMPISRDFVAVQVRRTAATAADFLPVSMLSAALGQPLFAAAGVRTGDNRKATLHLVDRAGNPVAYAKFGWNAPTDALVENEGRALRLVGGRPDGVTRAPRLITELNYGGHPVVVTEPLPLGARGGPKNVRRPTPEEMYCLTPVVRHDRAWATRHFISLTARLQTRVENTDVGNLARASLTLASLIRANDHAFPVTSLWHGDFTPWNQARDRNGQLWVWDWEHSESDAVAGLDALHWASSKQRLAQHAEFNLDLERSLIEARAYLTAAGVQPRDRPTVASIYALTVVERACDFAAHARSWGDALIGPEGLWDLLGQATTLTTGVKD